jgi:hypothetical protein
LPLARKEARLAVVDEEEIPLLQRFQERRPEVVDPVVHRVAAGEPDGRHLRADVALEVGLDVAEEEIRLGPVMLGKFGVEVGEDVELGPQSGAVVHVGRVDARPEEGLASGYALEAGEVDVAGGQEVGVLLVEVISDDPDDADGGEVARGERDVGRSASEHPIDFSVRRFDAVICD